MMSRCAAPHQSLTCGKTVYIGRAAPQSTFDGLDSIQKPLCELYRKSKWDPKKLFDHMESTLHVFRSGLLLKPCNPLDKDVWFKIQDLESCSAVKAYNDPSCRGRMLFVPSDSASASMSEHPSIFALIMKRSTGGIKITDCHAFICSSDRAALTLVKATAHAFSDPSGWSDERPTLVELGLERPPVKIDNECYVDDLKDDCTPEYYDKPKLSGFFYTPRSDLIQKYSVKGEDCYGRPIGDGQEMIKPFICDEFEPPPRIVEPPRPAPDTAVIVLQNGCQQSCAALHCGANDTGSWRSKDKKKTQRQMNHYVQQSQVMLQSQVQPYTDPNGDQYLVSDQPCQTGCGDPIYTKFLPPNNGMSPQYAQAYGAQPPVDYNDYRQMAMQNGRGDYGPPQNVEYVEYYGNGDADLYSRKLPGQGANGYMAGGRNYDGNFMMKKSDAYGMQPRAHEIMAALSIRDQY